MNELLVLHESDKIAESKTRHCYLHPDTPDKVIKIIVDLKEQKKRIDSNIKEWRYYQRLIKMPISLDFIPDYYGFVNTNKGRGLVSECIRDFDGSISVRLQEVVSHRVNYNLSQIEDKLEKLSRFIINNNIQLFDLNRYNILIQVLEDGSYNPVSIDLKGPYNNYEFIPFSTYIPYFSRLKLERRGKRLMDIIRKAREEFRSSKTL